MRLKRMAMIGAAVLVFSAVVIMPARAVVTITWNSTGQEIVLPDGTFVPVDFTAQLIWTSDSALPNRGDPIPGADVVLDTVTPLAAPGAIIRTGQFDEDNSRAGGFLYTRVFGQIGGVDYAGQSPSAFGPLTVSTIDPTTFNRYDPGRIVVPIVPEPGTFALLALGAIGVFARRRIAR